MAKDDIIITIKASDKASAVLKKVSGAMDELGISSDKSKDWTEKFADNEWLKIMAENGILLVYKSIESHYLQEKNFLKMYPNPDMLRDQNLSEYHDVKYWNRRLECNNSSYVYAPVDIERDKKYALR